MKDILKTYKHRLSNQDIDNLKLVCGKTIKGVVSDNCKIQFDKTKITLLHNAFFSFLHEKRFLKFGVYHEETDEMDDVYYPELADVSAIDVNENSYLYLDKMFTVKSISVYGFEYNNVQERISTENIFIFNSYDDRKLLLTVGELFGIIVITNADEIDEYLNGNEESLIKLKREITK